MTIRKRIEALEAGLSAATAPRSPESDAWLDAFYARHLRREDLSLDHIPAEDQAGWAEHVPDWPLADFLERLARVREEF